MHSLILPKIYDIGVYLTFPKMYHIFTRKNLYFTNFKSFENENWFEGFHQSLIDFDMVFPM